MSKVKWRNRAIVVLIGLAVALAVVAHQSTRVRAGWDVLPENQGSFKTVALQYTKAAGPDIRPAYRAFLTAIDPSTSVIAVCGDQADAADLDAFLRSCPRAHPERVHMVVVGSPITAWCKDRFLVTGSTPAALLTPKPPVTSLRTRGNDALVAGAIARAFPQKFHAVSTGMYFDSGDIVTTSTHLIVSDSLWRKNAGSHPNDAGAVRKFDRTLAAEFGRRVLHLHGVPDHHIGMFAAPLDDHTVVVGDPSMARGLWSKADADALGAADFSPQVARMFTRAAAQFQAAGFRVIRAPLVYFAPQEYLTYTNAVFETRGGSRIVYMPSYDIPDIDALGRAAYESAGWEVRPIPVRTLYRYRGTIGCLINVLERGR